jgi:hypothetical protein
MGRLPVYMCCFMLLRTSETVLAAADRVIYTLDFSKQPDGDAVAWLKTQGFVFHLNAADLAPRFENGRLILETVNEVAGVFVQTLNLPGVRRLRVRWGVDRYPQGADWGKGVNRLPIAIMVSFGQEKMASGSVFLPDAPYFLGVFLGEKEEVGRVYTGMYYKKGGRYLCQPCGVKPGQTVVTELDLERHFTAQFQQNTLPPVSSVGFQMNTTDTKGGARAFLISVEFLD